MNILFISAVFPYPLHSGGQIRVYNLLKRLSNEHAITLCAYIRTEEERQYIKHVSFCKRVHVVYRGRGLHPLYIAKSLIGSYPLLMATYDNEEMKKIIQQESPFHDCIHIEPGYVWPAIYKTNRPIVVCEHNIEHTIYQGYIHKYRYPFITSLMKRDVQKLITWEKRIWKQSSAVIAVSDDDAKEIQRYRSNSVFVVPNGVDIDFFQYRPLKKISNDCTCLFVGNFRWIQNRDAVEFLLNDLWPKIHAKFPLARLRIVGQEFPNRLLPVDNSVSIIPFVEDIRDEFARCDIVFAPIRIGGGTKYKILEAMAAGRAVITTNKGAEGLDISHNKTCYIAENEYDWINIVSFIIDNPLHQIRVVKEARNFVQKKYSWDKIAHILSDVWKRSCYQS
ncbi:MAG: glycosyltransferase family 4 protein [Patescibacteria group bacterium]|nr:glycosyltransferase family 4 protein [Patescibacteria group bacterium]